MQRPQIRTLADIQDIESLPLAERRLPPTTYDVIRLTAERHPDAIAIEFLAEPEAPGTRLISYRDLHAGIVQTANLLLSIGTHPTHAISLLLPNTPQSHFAIWAAQAVAVLQPINPLLQAPQIGEVLRAAGSHTLITVGPAINEGIWEKACAAARASDTVRHVFAIDSLDSTPTHEFRPAYLDAAQAAAGGAISFNEFNRSIAQQNDTELASREGLVQDRVVARLHTGGTTGAPKIAQWTHANQVYSAWAMSFMRGVSPGDVMLCGLPLFHANALLAGGLSQFYGGARVVFLTPEGYRNPKVIPNMWRYVERFRATSFGGVPTVYASLLDQLDRSCDISSLKHCGCGAAPMPKELFNRFENATGIRIQEGYGLTEGTCASATNPPDGERRVGSVGFRFPYQQLRVVILQDGRIVRDAATDETGVILISGPSVFAGYTQAELNVAAFPEPGWLNTGDLGRIDGDGYLWLVGRAKDLIIRGGHNIDPIIIESALVDHPAVAMAAAVGQPDKRAGEIPVAYVKLRAGAAVTETELKDYARGRVGEGGAAPARVEIVDALPLTAVGKIFKPALRERAAEHALRQALGNANIGAEVATHTDAKYGLSARISLRDPGQRDQAANLLGAFALKLEIG